MPILELNGVSKSFGALVVAEDIGFRNDSQIIGDEAMLDWQDGTQVNAVRCHLHIVPVAHSNHMRQAMVAQHGGQTL